MVLLFYDVDEDAQGLDACINSNRSVEETKMLPHHKECNLN